jgi:hypothetical protein
MTDCLVTAGKMRLQLLKRKVPHQVLKLLKLMMGKNLQEGHLLTTNILLAADEL